MHLRAPQRLRLLPVLVVAAAAVLGVLLSGVVRAPSATAAGGPVNITLNIPADVRPNPCTPGDVVNVSGTMHIVYYVRDDGQGGFHLDQLVDEKGNGVSLTTGENYRLADNYDHSFYARPPFPSNDTQTHSVELVSQGGSPNLIMGYALHTTVNAGGVPTASVDNVRLDCAG